MKAKNEGAVISVPFVVWTETDDGRKGRFVVNFCRQSKHWNSRGVRLEGLTEFAGSIQHKDHCLSVDIEKGYRHLRLHPSMRKWFIFRYHGRYFESIALPFGWGQSP